MVKKPPIDLQAALAAAKAKLAEPPPRVSPLTIERASQPKMSQPKMPKPKAAMPNKTQSQDEASMTLEKLAQAWVQTKNFPKSH